MSVRDFIQALEHYREMTDGFLAQAHMQFSVGPAHLAEAVHAYIGRPAKRLRPALLLMSCEAVGGEAARAVPAAAAVEVFHTWTLVHDDIIDNDDTRRGGPSVHVQAASAGRASFDLEETDARRYGRDVAILAGDIQQGWSIALLTECVVRGVSERVVLALIRQMARELNPALIEGEMLDVQLAARPVESVRESELLEMMRLKTGRLLNYAACAGAAIGRNGPPSEVPVAAALGRFAERCGIAFQLQDDILGITGDEKTLGKPVGSDIVEGKLTLPVLHVLAAGNGAARTMLKEILGNRAASPERVDQVRNCLVEQGGVSYARRLAERLLQEALSLLDRALPDSEHRRQLRGWAEFMVERTH